jgi:hypothetical protein
VLTPFRKDAYIVAVVLLENSSIRPASVWECSLLLQRKQSTERKTFMESSTVVWLLLALYSLAEFIKSYGLLLLAMGLVATLTIAWRRRA